MKKLLIITNEFNSGGVGKFVQKIVSELNKSFAIYIVSRDTISKNDLHRFKIIESFKVTLPSVIDFWPLKEIFFFLKGKAFFENYKFDFILCNYPFHISDNLKAKTRIVQIFHSLHKQYYQAYTPNKIGFLIIKLLHFFMTPMDHYRIKHSTGVVFVSKAAFDSVSIDKKIFIPNPIGKKFKKRAGSLRRKKDIKVAFIARKDPFKGIDMLETVLETLFINNFKKYKRVYFYIIGLKKLNMEYPNTNVLGKRSFKETMDLLGKTDILLSTSYLENSPNVIFEALETGNIPLVSNVGDSNEILGGNQMFVYKSRDVSAVINKLDFILREPDLVDKELNKIGERVSKEYSLNLISKKIGALLK